MNGPAAWWINLEIYANALAKEYFDRLSIVSRDIWHVRSRVFRVFRNAKQRCKMQEHSFAILFSE